MNYLNYRVMFGDKPLSENLIAKGSFSCNRAKRIKSSWVDANGVEHFVYYPKDKTVIEFSLRERSKVEQEELLHLFANTEEINLSYWDDLTCTYKSGLFYMDRPKFTHRTLNSGLGGIMYDATKIKLTEY